MRLLCDHCLDPTASPIRTSCPLGCPSYTCYLFFVQTQVSANLLHPSATPLRPQPRSSRQHPLLRHINCLDYINATLSLWLLQRSSVWLPGVSTNCGGSGNLLLDNFMKNTTLLPNAHPSICLFVINSCEKSVYFSYFNHQKKTRSLRILSAN